METRFVTGVGGHGGSGDPSPFTALGVFCGVKAAAHAQYGSDSLAGKRVVVQGAGNVARHLTHHLVKDGAKVFVTDIFEDKARALCAEAGAEYITPDEVYGFDCDILSPNALGAVINDDTIGQKNERVHGEALKQKGILYAPDYVINAGGLINVSSEIENWSVDQVTRKVEGIYDTLVKIFATAKTENILTVDASNRIAEERIAKVRHIHGNFTGVPNIRGGN
jgi:leucine dehydrogenase